MKQPKNRRVLPLARRGVGLALALMTVWGIRQTTDWTGVRAALKTLGANSSVAVGLMAGQLGSAPDETVLAGLDGVGRLFVDYTPLLAAGKGQVAALRQGQEQEPEKDATEELARDDLEQPDLQAPNRGESIRETTGKGKSGARYLSQGDLYLYNRTDLGLTAGVLGEGTVNLNLQQGPQILIYHTHGSEAYAQTDGDLYQESDAYRTTDCSHNVVRVGEEMAQVFRDLGFQVIHDTNLYDYPAYTGAYDRSDAAIRQYLKQYPTIQVALDVHRDALQGKDGAIYKLVSQENAGKVAQVMLVVGTGAGRTDWRNNLALGVQIQKQLLADYTSLARPIVLRSNMYNQDLLPGALLVEVGGHGNTLTEAVQAAHLFAESAGKVLLAHRS